LNTRGGDERVRAPLRGQRQAVEIVRGSGFRRSGPATLGSDWPR
jgi:hypothetical protein